MKILACYNIKGGVGKTTTAVNLAYLCAHEGNRTLLVDLDPQGAATYCYRIKPKLKGGGKALVKYKTDVDEFIKATDYDNLHLLPADFSLRNLDLILDNCKHRRTRLETRLDALEEQYDYLFIDCAPSISLVSENVFKAADALIIPTIPAPLSMHTLAQIKEFCEERQLRSLKLLPFYSMVDKRKSLHRDLLEHSSNELQVPMLKTSIPYASEVESMTVRREPLSSFDHSSAASRAYDELWLEIKTSVNF